MDEQQLKNEVARLKARVIDLQQREIDQAELIKRAESILERDRKTADDMRQLLARVDTLQADVDAKALQIDGLKSAAAVVAADLVEVTERKKHAEATLRKTQEQLSAEASRADNAEAVMAIMKANHAAAFLAVEGLLASERDAHAATRQLLEAARSAKRNAIDARDAAQDELRKAQGQAARNLCDAKQAAERAEIEAKNALARATDEIKLLTHRLECAENNASNARLDEIAAREECARAVGEAKEQDALAQKAIANAMSENKRLLARAERAEQKLTALQEEKRKNAPRNL